MFPIDFECCCVLFSVLLCFCSTRKHVNNAKKLLNYVSFSIDLCVAVLFFSLLRCHKIERIVLIGRSPPRHVSHSISCIS